MDIHDLERGFHNRDGWFFRRDSDDGNVRIWKVRWEKAWYPCDGGCPPLQTHRAGCPAAGDPHAVPVLEVGPYVIPENEWASVVASVGRNGETAEAWQCIRDFHNGRQVFVQKNWLLASSVGHARARFRVSPGATKPLAHCARHDQYDDSCSNCYDLQYALPDLKQRLARAEAERDEWRDAVEVGRSVVADLADKFEEAEAAHATQQAALRDIIAEFYAREWRGDFQCATRNVCRVCGSQHGKSGREHYEDCPVQKLEAWAQLLGEPGDQ